MKSRLNKKNIELRKDEAGYALMWVLVVIILAGIILVPLFLLMTAGLTSSHNHEERMLRFYAADAGIEDAIWQLVNGSLEVNPFDLNDSYVEVSIVHVGGTAYRITSTATDNNDKTTTVKCQVSANVYSFLDNAITSKAGVTIQPNTTVNGNVQYDDPGGVEGGGTIVGEEINQSVQRWPTAAELSAFYLEDVKDLTPYSSKTIDVTGDVSDPTPIGPLYRNGDLEIKSNKDAWAKLQGTVYVNGNLSFKVPVGQGLTLDLNGKTIYVTGTIGTGTGLRIMGSGCIIAVGNITFQPHMLSGESDFVFVMSVNGFTNFLPQESFNGSLAGNSYVDLKPNCSLTWSEPSSGLNVPLSLMIARSQSTVLTYTTE